MKKIIITAVVVILLLAASCFPLKLFVIGEPVDGNQLYYEIWEKDNGYDILIVSMESAMALRDVQVQQEEGVVTISLRKVLVSPLFSDGDVSVHVDDLNTEQIILGGKTILP